MSHAQMTTERYRSGIMGRSVKKRYTLKPKQRTVGRTVKR